MVGNVFALMRVGTGKYERGQVFAPHHLAEVFQSLVHSLTYMHNSIFLF